MFSFLVHFFLGGELFTKDPSTGSRFGVHHGVRYYTFTPNLNLNPNSRPKSETAAPNVIPYLNGCACLLEQHARLRSRALQPATLRPPPPPPPGEDPGPEPKTQKPDIPKSLKP